MPKSLEESLSNIRKGMRYEKRPLRTKLQLLKEAEKKERAQEI